jgi:hypothetical protein
MGRLSVVLRNGFWDRQEARESQRSTSRQMGRRLSTIGTHLVSSGWKVRSGSLGGSGLPPVL